jgi:hypothetical protein
MRVRINSECKHCSRPITIEVDEELNWKLLSVGASPVLFEPDMNWKAFSGQNIIHDY